MKMQLGEFAQAIHLNRRQVRKASQAGKVVVERDAKGVEFVNSDKPENRKVLVMSDAERTVYFS